MISRKIPALKLPSQVDIAAVYAIIVLMIYSWTILWFLWKLPSWMYFMQAHELLFILSTSIATNFAESLLVLFGIIFLAVIAPPKWFADKFIVRGPGLVILSLGYLMFLAFQFQEEAYPKFLVLFSPIFFIFSFILIYFLPKIRLIARAIEFIARQSVIFLYIYIPLSIISVLIWLFLFFPRSI